VGCVYFYVYHVYVCYVNVYVENVYLCVNDCKWLCNVSEMEI